MERTFGDFFANYMDIGRISPSILESKIHQLQIEAEERRLTLGCPLPGWLMTLRLYRRKGNCWVAKN